jgi:hypothetical protein
MKQQLIYWFFTASLSFNNRVQAQVTNVLIDTTSTISKSTPSQILAESNHPVFRPKAFMAPVALMTAGLLVQGQVSRRVQSEVLKHYPGFWSPVDNYLQYAPSVVMLGLGAAGVKGKHSFGDQLALAVLANGLAQGLTFTLKYTVAYPRPDGNGQESFPSGHTSSAFTGATLLAKEYGGRSGWYTVAGYAAATTVGGFRIIKNRHWLADVLFGAGVGIASTEAVYLAYPWLKHLVIRRKQTAIMPLYQGNWGGFCLVSVF